MSDLFTVFNDNGIVQINGYYSHYSLKLPIIESSQYNANDISGDSYNRAPYSLFFYQVNEPNSFIWPNPGGMGSYGYLKNNARAFCYHRNGWEIKSKYGLQLFNEMGDLIYDACSLPLRIIDTIFDFSPSNTMHTFSTRRYSQEIAVCALCLPSNFHLNYTERILITMPDIHTISWKKESLYTDPYGNPIYQAERMRSQISILIADVTGL